MPAGLRATPRRTTIIGLIGSGFFSASEKSPSHGGIASGLEGVRGNLVRIITWRILFHFGKPQFAKSSNFVRW